MIQHCAAVLSRHENFRGNPPPGDETETERRRGERGGQALPQSLLHRDEDEDDKRQTEDRQSDINDKQQRDAASELIC